MPERTQEVSAAPENGAEERSQVTELLQRTPGVHYDELPVRPLISVEQAQQLGRNALNSAELARDRQEIEHPEQFVGEETDLQVKERLAEDQADYETEIGQGLALERSVVKKTQEGVAREVEATVSNFMRQKSPKIFELAQFRDAKMREILAGFDRVFGERNDAA